MARSSRNLDWGFPRWRDYGASSAATTTRTCDHDGCDEVGDRPAPKATNRPERWYFCEAHAAEYNRNWNYFAGLSAADTAAREADEAAETGFSRARHWAWTDADAGRSRAELDALTTLGLGGDADRAAIKAAYRRLAKINHPDIRPGDPAAAARFQAVQAAYDLLQRADSARTQAGPSA